VNGQALIPGVEPAYEPWVDDPDVALTPRAVARQGIEFARGVIKHTPRRLLDPCSGSGVFGAEAWGLDTTGIEPARHAWQWERHYGEAIGLPFEQAAPRLKGQFDLVVGNPPFSLLIDFVDLGYECLTHGGVLCYLGLNDWGQRGRDHEDLWRRLRPSYMARIPGAIQFKTGTNPKTGKPWTTDMRSYCWWAWVKGTKPRFTKMTTLDRLEPEQLRWVEPPGQETTT